MDFARETSWSAASLDDGRIALDHLPVFANFDGNRAPHVDLGLLLFIFFGLLGPRQDFGRLGAIRLFLLSNGWR